MARLATLALLLPLALGACRSSGASSASDPRFDTDYVLVILRTGPREKEYSPGQTQDIFAGHMSNIRRLASERKLFVAGPFGKERHDPTWRGIFVFDVRTVEEARELTSTDPGVQSGVFVVDALPWRSAHGLPRLLDLEHEREERAQAEGRELAMADRMRTYAMLTTDDAASAERELAPLFESGKVLLAGRLGGDRSGGGMYVLDFDGAPGAKQALAASWPRLESTSHVDSWFATRSVEALSRAEPAR